MENPKIILKKGINIKMYLKNKTIQCKSMFKKLINLCISLDIDFLFFYLVLFIFIQSSWWKELLFAYGVSMIYKKIIKDILNIKRTK